MRVFFFAARKRWPRDFFPFLFPRGTALSHSRLNFHLYRFAKYFNVEPDDVDKVGTFEDGVHGVYATLVSLFFLFFPFFSLVLSSGVAANIAAGALGTRIEINKTRGWTGSHRSRGIRYRRYSPRRLPFFLISNTRTRTRSSVDRADSSRLLPDFYVIFASSRNDSISIRLRTNHAVSDFSILREARQLTRSPSSNELLAKATDYTLLSS